MGTQVACVLLVVASSLMRLDVVFAFIAFDCKDGNLNYTTLSLNSVAPCNEMNVEYEEEDVHVQLLQPRDTRYVMTKSCLIVVKYVAFHCGMSSHNSIIKGGYRERVIPISKGACESAHLFGTVHVFGLLYTGFRADNTTQIRAVTLAGVNGVDGSCEGGTLSSDEETIYNVVAEGSISVTLSTRLASYDSLSRKIRMPSGSTCREEDLVCLDYDDGYTFWSLEAIHKCDSDSYYVLYNGLAKKSVIYDRNGETLNVTMYSVSRGDSVWSVRVSDDQYVCGKRLYTTEFRKLLVYDYTSIGMPYYTGDTPEGQDVDMFMYINNKMAHMASRMLTDMRAMYRDLAGHLCRVERSALLTKLSLALTSPDTFAYDYMGEPGYHAVVMGEAIHLFKCKPVSVTYRPSTECTNELPITFSNASMYMIPRSRILTDVGTPIACSNYVSPRYLISGAWYSVKHTLSEVQSPEIIAPTQPKRWKSVNIGNLATAGIYTAEEMEKLRKQIMSPVERNARISQIASVANDEPFSLGSEGLAKLMNTDVVEGAINRVWEKTYGFFVAIGDVSSLGIGIYVVIALIKYLANTLVHGISLHRAFGCSFHLLGALWGAVASAMIVHFGRIGGEEKGAGSRRYDTDEPAMDAEMEKLEPNAPDRVIASMPHVAESEGRRDSPVPISIYPSFAQR